MDHRTEKVQPGHALASQIPHQIPHRLHDPGGAPAKVLNGSVNSIYITFLRELKHPSPPNHCQWCGCYPLTWCTSNFGPKWLATIKDPVSKCKRSSPKRIWLYLIIEWQILVLSDLRHSIGSSPVTSVVFCLCFFRFYKQFPERHPGSPKLRNGLLRWFFQTPTAKIIWEFDWIRCRMGIFWKIRDPPPKMPRVNQYTERVWCGGVFHQKSAPTIESLNFHTTGGLLEQTPEVWCQAVRKDFNPPTILEILDAQSLEVCVWLCVCVWNVSQFCSNFLFFWSGRGNVERGMDVSLLVWFHRLYPRHPNTCWKVFLDPKSIP